MAQSYQKEIPKARVNITLELETGGAKKSIELPLSLLLLADLSNGKTKGALSEREKLRIDKNNLNDVLKDFSPEVSMTVPNRIKDDDTEMRINLSFDSLKSFHPDEIVKKVPELKNLIAMRNLLKDFRSNVTDNVSFRRALEKIAKEKEKLVALQSRLKPIAHQGNDQASNESDGGKE